MEPHIQFDKAFIQFHQDMEFFISKQIIFVDSFSLSFLNITSTSGLDIDTIGSSIVTAGGLSTQRDWRHLLQVSLPTQDG